ncbi:hypothetical protein ABIE50_003116 [Chitinophaga sp. OAE865]
MVQTDREKFLFPFVTVISSCDPGSFPVPISLKNKYKYVIILFTAN